MGSEVVGIVSANSVEFVEAIFHCYHEGQVGVPLRDAADPARIAVAGVNRIVTPGHTTGWRRSAFIPSPTDDTAQILFTSGTTGAEKGVVLSRNSISHTTRRLNAVLGVDGTIREYVGIPVYYSFGMGRCRAVGAAGGEYFIPPDGFNPSEIAAMLTRGEINALSAVPTQWRLLLKNADLFDGNALGMRWIEIGSQVMSRAEKEHLKRMFPNAAIVQHYGLTEASRSTFLRVHQEEGDALESVGRAEGLAEVRVNGDGLIMIRGPHVASHAISPGGLVPLTDADGWLTTSDLGEIRHGLLYYHGRADDQINCGGVKLFPEAIEAALSGMPGSAEGVVVSRMPDPLRGDGILVSYTPAEGRSPDAVRAAAIKAAQGLGVQAAGAIAVQAVEEIPRTETGKIRRQGLVDQYTSDHGSLTARLELLWKDALDVEVVGPGDNFFDLGGGPKTARKLAPQMLAEGFNEASIQAMLDGFTVAEIVELSERPAPAVVVADPAQELEQQILNIWRSALNQPTISLNQSFYDIGGDSLSAITVTLQMERAGLDPQLARGIFAGKTIAMLAQEMAAARTPVPVDVEPAKPIAPPRLVKTPIAGLSESLNFVKGMVLLCMLASHWMPVYIDAIFETSTPVRRLFAPIWSLGSPTLAFVYGMGITLFVLRLYESSKPAFYRSIRTMTALLAAGLIIGGTAEVASAVVRGEHIGLADTLLLMYGPFAYFLPATLLLPFWLKHVRRNNATVLRLLFVAMALYVGYITAWKYLPERHESHALMAVYKMLAGHWSLLQMAAISLFGGALGILIDRRIRKEGNLNGWLGYGTLMAAVGGVMSIAAFDFDSWFKFPKDVTLWSVFTYAGIAIMAIAAFERVMDRVRRITPVRFLLELVCCLGILLFPAYVAQSLVYHTSSILSRTTGLSFLQAISIAIACFLVALAWPLGRLYALHYGHRPRKD